MVLMRREFIGAVLLTIILFGCDAAGTRTAPSPIVSPSTAVTPSREPAALARYPEEQAVLDVLTASGMRVELVGGSKAETLLGVARRARVFIGTLAAAASVPTCSFSMHHRATFACAHPPDRPRVSRSSPSP